MYYKHLKILNLNDNQYNILIKILNITEKDNTKDWIPILDNLLNGLNSNKYEKLVEVMGMHSIEG